MAIADVVDRELDDLGQAEPRSRTGVYVGARNRFRFARYSQELILPSIG